MPGYDGKGTPVRPELDTPPNWRSSPRHAAGQERQLPALLAPSDTGVPHRALPTVPNAGLGTGFENGDVP
jgi:hypothetical protein